MEIERLDEESKGLLRRIVEAQAYRQRMAANIRGHGMKYVHDLEAKIQLARDLEQSLLVMGDVERLYGRLDGGDLLGAIRGRMDRIPYPGSKLELAICMSLTDRAERVAGSAYVDGRASEFAAIARTLIAMDRPATRRGEKLFVEFCGEETNRPHAQQMLDRWLALAIRSLGRPGTAGDVRSVALGLRTKSCADCVRELIEAVDPLLRSCRLALPEPDRLGVELGLGEKSGTTAGRREGP